MNHIERDDNRETGYYWILYKDEPNFWTVAEWTSGFNCWNGGDLDSIDIVEVDERQILNPNEA
jgi:hypothetical protein